MTTHAELRKLDKNFDMRVRAKEAVVRMLRNGTLVRPTICPKCGAPAKIEAHHPDYSKPTEIIWLCHKCHMNEHPKCKSRRVGKIRQAIKDSLIIRALISIIVAIPAMVFVEHIDKSGFGSALVGGIIIIGLNKVLE